MKPPKTTTPTDAEPERIAKVIARAGLCSRREAEAWIAAGRVQINGRVLDTPGVTVKPGDVVLVDGQPLPARDRTRLWLFHKPRGLVTTTHDPEGRPTVFDALPPELPRVMTIGRLDINTEGLLLLTNDGGLARVLELPATGWLRRYRVRAHGEVDQAALDALRDGIAIDGILYGAVEATIDRRQGDNVWLTVGLREGKNREVKNILLHLGLDVNRLIRMSFGPFMLGDLAVGAVEEVPRRVLKEQLGERLAAEAGADFALREGDREPIQKKLGPAERRPAASEDAPEARGRDARPPRHGDAERSRRRHEADIEHNAEAGRRGGKTSRPAQGAGGAARGERRAGEDGQRRGGAGHIPAGRGPVRAGRGAEAVLEGHHRADKAPGRGGAGPVPGRGRADRPARGDRPDRAPEGWRPERDALSAEDFEAAGARGREGRGERRGPPRAGAGFEGGKTSAFGGRGTGAARAGKAERASFGRPARSGEDEMTASGKGRKGRRDEAPGDAPAGKRFGSAGKPDKGGFGARPGRSHGPGEDGPSRRAAGAPARGRRDDAERGEAGGRGARGGAAGGERVGRTRGDAPGGGPRGAHGGERAPGRHGGKQGGGSGGGPRDFGDGPGRASRRSAPGGVKADGGSRGFGGGKTSGSRRDATGGEGPGRGARGPGAGARSGAPAGARGHGGAEPASGSRGFGGAKPGGGPKGGSKPRDGGPAGPGGKPRGGPGGGKPGGRPGGRDADRRR